MKKLIVFLTLLFVIANTQHGTLVTHYDLEGNLLSEEIMAPIEDEITYYDSNELSIDSSNDLKTQDDPNQISTEEGQYSESNDLTIENILQPVESNQQSNNLIGSSFEIQPVVNQQPKIETSIDQYLQQEQELDRQQNLQEDHNHQNIDNIKQKQEVPGFKVSQEKDVQEQDFLSPQKEEMQLQPVVVTQNQVIDLQQDPNQQINISNTSNEQQISDLQQQQQNQENQLNLRQSEQKQTNVNTNPTQNKIIQDMPIQEQIIIQSGNEIHALPDSLNSLQENQVKQQPRENQQNMPLEEQIINQSNNEVHALSDSLNSLQENQVKQQEQINIQEINTDDQIQITQNFGRIMQDMIPESDEDIIIQDPQEEEGKSLATQTSQIEEDIKFNNEDEQQYNVEVTQQKVLNDKQENQTTKTQENKKIEQEEQSNVQEITQELTQAKREIPEDQLQQIVTSEEKNVNENQVTRTINNPFEDDGLKLSSEVIQDKCIIIYSQCEYQGFALEVCDSLKDIEKFKHKIKSIYIPQGYGLTIFQNQNFNGQSHRYTSSQRCLEREVSFIQLQIDQTILLKHQNLRGQN